MAPHKAEPGKSRTFAPTFLKKKDAKSVIAANLAINEEVQTGNVVLVSVTTADMETSSDGSGMPAQLTVTEYKFPHGKPTKDVNPT